MSSEQTPILEPNTEKSEQRKPTNTSTFDRINLSAGFITMLTEASPKSKIIEQLLSDMDLNKFKEFLGLVKKTVTESDEELLKRNFTSAEIDKLVQGLIGELVEGNSSDIKCIIHNFLKASAKKDIKFVNRVKAC